MEKYPKLLLLPIVFLLVGLLIGYTVGHKIKPSSEVFVPSYLQRNQSTYTGPLKIKEMGIQLNSYISLPQLKYKYVKATEYGAAILYTSQLEKYCPPKGPNAALGVLFKTKGVYSAVGDVPILLKQKDGYYYSYRPPQQECQADADEKLEQLRYFQEREVQWILLQSMNFF